MIDQVYKFNKEFDYYHRKTNRNHAKYSRYHRMYRIFAKLHMAKMCGWCLRRMKIVTNESKEYLKKMEEINASIKQLLE